MLLFRDILKLEKSFRADPGNLSNFEFLRVWIHWIVSGPILSFLVAALSDFGNYRSAEYPRFTDI